MMGAHRVVNERRLSVAREPGHMTTGPGDPFASADSVCVAGQQRAMRRFGVSEPRAACRSVGCRANIAREASKRRRAVRDY
jgi:hypothetical protein